MTDRPRSDDDDDAPELHNSEQDDEHEQSQDVADEALHGEARARSPLDSEKVRGGDDEDTQDLIDRMRDMEQSGRIDMGAYRGEPNFDDEDDMYGNAADNDDDEDEDDDEE